VFFYNFISRGGDASRMWCAAALQLCRAAGPAHCQGTGCVPACEGSSTACPQRQCLVWHCSGRTFWAPVPRGSGRAAGRRAAHRSWARGPWRCTRAWRRGRARGRGTGWASCAPGRSWTACGGGRRARPRCGATLPRRAPEQRLCRRRVPGRPLRLRCGAGRLCAPARTGCQPASCGRSCAATHTVLGRCREQLGGMHSASARVVPRQALERLPAACGGEAGGEAQCGGLWGTRPGAVPCAPDSHGTPAPALPSLKGRRQRCHTASSWHIYTAVRSTIELCKAWLFQEQVAQAIHFACLLGMCLLGRREPAQTGKFINEIQFATRAIREQEPRPRGVTRPQSARRLIVQPHPCTCRPHDDCGGQGWRGAGTPPRRSARWW
jgi:hypothetical protein